MAKELPALDLSKMDFIWTNNKTLCRNILYYRGGFKAIKSNAVQPIKSRRPDIPVWERSSLTIDQAAVYCGVGKDKLRELTDRPDCPFVLWIGSKRLVRRKKLDEYLDKAFSI